VQDVLVRPDGRRFVDSWDEEGDFAFVREDEAGAWLEHGFAVLRREDEYAVPTIEPAPHPFLGLEAVDLERLRLLDDELRQDVPGTDGWRWQHDAFVAQTYSSPSVYLVTPEYTGICRVWIGGPTPRVGFVGVRRDERQRGLGRALVAAALGETRALGHAEVTTEIDVENAASQALFRGFGARRIGGYVELRRSRRSSNPAYGTNSWHVT
jgi:ribosomal protein S18 acetylase RimI-like enzyme